MSRMNYTTSIDIRTLTKVAIGIFASIGLGSLGLAPSVLAQATPNPLQDFQNRDNTDPFSNRGNNGGASGVMDLIHRSVLAPSRSVEEFSSEQRRDLDATAADFRAQQLERLRNQKQQATPAAPASPATPATVVPAPATPTSAVPDKK